MSNKDLNFDTIEEICNRFNIVAPKTGFSYRGAVSHPINKHVVFWWPAENNTKDWQNTINASETRIEESHSGEEKNAEHFETHIHGEQIRCVFYKYKDKPYKFVGVFVLNQLASQKEKKIVWVKIADELYLGNLTNN